MRRDDGLGRRLHGVEERRVGDVRDVDHHAELVHRLHDAQAQRREATRLAGVAGASAESVRVGPRERHVTSAAIVELVEPRDEPVVGGVAQAVRALDADQERDLVGRRGRANLVRRARQDGDARVLRDEAVDRVELRDRVRVRLLSGIELRRHPHGQELGVEPARLHARDVGLRVRKRPGEVRVLVHEALRDVVVRVDDDRRAVQVVRREDGRPRVRRRSGRRRDRRRRRGGRSRRRDGRRFGALRRGARRDERDRGYPGTPVHLRHEGGRTAPPPRLQNGATAGRRCSWCHRTATRRPGTCRCHSSRRCTCRSAR